MKTFDEIFGELQNGDNSELNKLWEELKIERKKARKIAGPICLIIDIFIVMMVLKFSGFGMQFNSIFMLIYIIIFTIIFVFILNAIVFAIVSAFSGASKKDNEFTIKYKNIVINKLMNNFYHTVEYFPDKGMPEYIYKELRYEHYDRYKTEDYFEALINNKTSIQMAEILTEDVETYKDSNGHTQTRTITKFHGLFAKVEMDKSINSELEIIKNGSVTFNKRLKMDSSEFEKYFDVKTSNQIIGMQLLTADVMEELIDFENKTNMKFDIFIKGNELYLRFHSGNMFEPTNLKNGPLDKNSIQKYFYMLNFTYNLSNRLIEVVKDTEI